MESVKSSSGRNTWRIAVPMAMNHSCIHNSAITSNRISRSIVLPCISTVNPVNRLKLIGQVILQQSLIQIPANHQRLHICWCNDFQPVCICGSISGHEAEIMDQCACPYARFLLAVLPESSYLITARLQLFTMAVGKTSRSMKLIRNWLSTMALLLFRRVSGLPKISRMLKER